MPIGLNRGRTVTLSDFINGKTSVTPPLRVPVVDLFCGAGGFSCGAALAGHTVRLAVDSDDTALEWHKKNHPQADHYAYSLPDDRLLAQLPAPDTMWHFHGSPPCQLLSQAAGGGQRKDRWDEGLANIRFYINLVLERRPASWTMEQVPNDVVLGLLEAYRARHPEVVDYTVVNMQHFGVPQARKRVIAGSPWIVKRILDLRDPMQAPRVIDFCHGRPKGAVGLKGTSTSQGSKKNPLRKKAFHRPSRLIPRERRVKKSGVCGPAPTVTALSTLRWTDDQLDTIRMLSVREEAQLQTFPDSYKFPDRGKEGHRMVGNSIPPMFVERLLFNYRLPASHPAVGNPAVFPPPAPASVC